MYRKNTASQYVYFCLVNATTGAALTGATVTAYRALDNGSQATATGTTTELANGHYRFNLSQADTNADNGSYLFTAANAVSVEKTVVFTQANPTDAVRFGLTALPNVAQGSSGALPTGNASGQVTVATLTAGAIQSFWDALTSGLSTAGSIGKWILDNLNATVSSRASQTSVDTLATYVDTEVAAIKAKTDNLPSDPADASDIASAFGTVNATLAVIAGYIDTEVAAIKAKTDNLPIDPADASDIAASFSNLTSLVNTLTSYVDTEVAAIKAKTDNLPANPAAVGDIPTAAQIADAVLSESVDDHENVAHSLAKYISIIKKANTVVDGVVSSAITPTTLTFASNVAYPTGAFKHAVLTFVTGNLIEQNSPIISYNATNGVIVVEEPFTEAPAATDQFIIVPTTHVHSVAAIVAGVWSYALSGIDTAGSAAKVLSDAGTGIATLLTRITSTVYNTFVDLAQMIVNDGTVNAQWSPTAMANIPVAGGTGARTVTITVRDPSANPIQNATVRISRTGESFALQTNASGVVVFSLDDATWTVAITATGFSFSPVSLVVSANVTQTYSMTAAGGGVTPSEPPLCTGFWTVYGVNGTIQAGAQVSIQASSPPAGSTGIVMEDAVRTATADNNGVVQFSNLIKGSVYIVWRTGSSRKFNITVPANAGNTVALGSIVG